MGVKVGHEESSAREEIKRSEEVERGVEVSALD